MPTTNILEGFVAVERLAADLGKNPATICRWMDRPDGLPFVRLGRKRYIHVETARQWMIGRTRRPNPTRRSRASAAERSDG
jgi:hypothetical protein